MIRRSVWIVIGTLLLIGGRSSIAQPPQSADDKGPPPLGVDKFYFELSKSKDNSTHITAERYIALVKVQEWSDLTGKYKPIAHYVRHAPDLSTVTIAIMKGSGADRSSDEKTVPVDKLSKTCQARVKQIDLLQKKLKEMASKAGPNGTPGMPMTDDHGADPSAKGPEAGSGAAPGPAAPDPSASEPDPLGFSEVQLAPPAGPGSIPSGAPPGTNGPATPGPGPGQIPASPPPGANGSAAPLNGGTGKSWQQDFEAFRQEFKVYAIGPGAPPAPADRKLVRAWEGTPGKHTAEWDVDFGELDDLREMSDAMAIMNEASRETLSRPENQKKLAAAKAAAAQIGEVTWEATFRRFNGPSQPIELTYGELPKPMQMMTVMDPHGSTPEQWSSFARGDRLRFKGRLSMSNIDLIKLEAREPIKVASSDGQSR